MDKMDIAMYDTFQKLLREDGHLKQTDFFAFRLGWQECQAAQHSVHPTCGDSAPLQALPTPEADTIAGHLPTPPTSG